MLDSDTQHENQTAERGSVADGASRRRFLELVGGTAGAAALSVLLAACGEEDAETDEEAAGPAEPSNDLEIVNYALLLEYLEEDFYDQVRKSGQIEDRDVQRLVQAVYQNEKEHAEALAGVASQLGGVPVKRPDTDFAAIIQAGEEQILGVAAMVENLGAAAYLGQATRIENLRILDAALTIHTVEARHAAAFNEIIGAGFKGSGKLEGSVPDGAFAKPMTRDEVLAAAAPFLRAP